MKYWLMKSEPSSFSIDHLKARPNRTEPWDGVRNYQARNYMRDEMRKGDQALFYQSSCPVPGVVGIMTIVSDAYPDPTAFDPDDEHYDPSSTPDAPRWYQVDVRFKRELGRTISLQELKRHRALRGMKLLQKGNRLSVMPLTRAEWEYILGLE